MLAWAVRTGIAEDRLLFIENRPGTKADHAGDNSAWEFSGYSVALKLFQGEGPYLICNDTLLRNHWHQGWSRLIAKWLIELSKTAEVQIWGDVRAEAFAWEEKPKVYLASWLWILPNRASLDAFRQILDHVLNTPFPEPSTLYLEYYKNWLRKPWWAGGWYGVPNDDEMNRKLRSIRMEHALSLEMNRHYPEALCSLGTAYPLWYRVIRLADRLLARFNAMKRTYA